MNIGGNFVFYAGEDNDHFAHENVYSIEGWVFNEDHEHFVNIIDKNNKPYQTTLNDADFVFFFNANYKAMQQYLWMIGTQRKAMLEHAKKTMN